MASNLSKSAISGSDLSFEFPDGTPIFKQLNFSFGPKSYGLVGPNGVGKSTFLKILKGDLIPTRGTIMRRGTLAALPQIVRGLVQSCAVHDSPEILDILEVRTLVEALERIQTDQTKTDDLELIGNDWNLLGRIQEIFSSLGIKHLGLDRKTDSLSGGEIVKVHLAKLVLRSPEILCLDEPTNNLDSDGRSALYEFIQKWRGCLLVASHDRELLSYVQTIVEFSNQGLQVYGGNYDFYLLEKMHEEETLEQKITTARQSEKKQKRELQTSLERQQKRMSRGKKLADKGSISAVAAGGLKRKAQGTMARTKDIHENRLIQAQTHLKELVGSIKEKNMIKIDLPQTSVPSRKELLEIKNFNFKYSNQNRFLFSKSVNFILMGPKRIQLQGQNGAGKTTLIKALINSLGRDEYSLAGHSTGEIQLKTNRVAYLDQDTAVLGDPSRSLLYRFSEMTPHLSESERRIRLGRFLFEQETTLKNISILSGGEKMRAALACVLFSENPPELLILDEPTNNLDIDSVEQIESALSNFNGAIILISHDEAFAKNIGISETIQLNPALLLRTRT